MSELLFVSLVAVALYALGAVAMYRCMGVTGIEGSDDAAFAALVSAGWPVFFWYALRDTGAAYDRLLRGESDLRLKVEWERERARAAEERLRKIGEVLK